MGDYCDGIERINIELSTQNKLALCDALAEFLQGELPLHTGDAEIAKDVLIGDRRQAALDYVAVRRRWQWLLDNLDLPLAEPKRSSPSTASPPGELPTVPPTRRSSTACRTIRPHLVEDGTAPASQDLRRHGLPAGADAHRGDPQAKCCAVASSSRCTCTPATATCTQHPGQLGQLRDAADGQPRRRPHHGAGALARRRHLRRARHRHHQARLPDRRRDGRFWAYKAKVDPEGRFNRGKLMRGGAAKPFADARLANLDAYTPSFNLMGHESLIMEQTEIGEISHDIKDCLRCGKCKPVCSTHVPRANLLYSPRNKILAPRC